MNPKKAEIYKILHTLADCQQVVIGYFELNEYHRARTVALECQSTFGRLAALLRDIEGLSDNGEGV